PHIYTLSLHDALPILRETFSTHTILAKVRLADLIEANVHPRWQTNFTRIRSKRVDFVICDAGLCPLVAVELDGASAKSVDQQERSEEHTSELQSRSDI